MHKGQHMCAGLLVVSLHCVIEKITCSEQGKLKERAISKVRLEAETTGIAAITNVKYKIYARGALERLIYQSVCLRRD